MDDHPRPEMPKSELPAIRDFVRRVEQLREQVDAHQMTQREIRNEWDRICASHETHLAALGGRAGITRRLIEDLRFDFDVLIHDLYRFIDRHR